MGAPPAPDQVVQPTDEAGPGRRRPAAVDDLLTVLGTYLALGLLGAVVWWSVYDPAHYTVSRNGGLGMGEVELAKRFGADGWYVVIAGVAGLVSGTVVTWWRGRDPLLTSVLVLVGSLLAAGVMAVVGGWIGPPDPRALVATAEAGARLPLPLEVDAAVCYLVWPVTALLGSLVVLWSPPPE